MYEWFISRRYLRAKHRHGFISLISLISVIGITVGVIALIVVLSVMNGFAGELRDRILALSRGSSESVHELCSLDFEVGRAFAAALPRRKERPMQTKANLRYGRRVAPARAGTVQATIFALAMSQMVPRLRRKRAFA